MLHLRRTAECLARPAGAACREVRLATAPGQPERGTTAYVHSVFASAARAPGAPRGASFGEGPCNARLRPNRRLRIASSPGGRFTPVCRPTPRAHTPIARTFRIIALLAVVVAALAGALALDAGARVRHPAKRAVHAKAAKQRAAAKKGAAA